MKVKIQKPKNTALPKKAPMTNKTMATDNTSLASSAANLKALNDQGGLYCEDDGDE